MSETANIAAMAEKVSKDVFRFLKWERKKSMDRNWDCASPELHKTKSGTHPSDAVFYYEHPYLGEYIYVNTDLKSYAKTTINKDSITKAIVSLAKATHCANHSESFERKYIHTDSQYDVVGLLFVYNHCGEYDSDFDRILNSIPQDELMLGANNKLYVISPQRIRKITDITNDIARLIAAQELPQPNKYSFLYPDLVLTKNILGKSEPATLEALLSDTLIIKHEYDEDNEIKSGYIVYFSKPDPSVEDFIYLLDSFSHYQMFDNKKPIRVRYTNIETPESDIANRFESATSKYSAIWGKQEAEMNKKLKFSIITHFSTSFSQSVLGMRDEEN